MFLFNLSKKIHDFDLKIRSPYHMRLSFCVVVLGQAVSPCLPLVALLPLRLWKSMDTGSYYLLLLLSLLCL